MKWNNMSHPSHELTAALSAVGRILIVPHRQPDGDAIGSAFGLQQARRENGLDSDVLLLEPIPAAYDWIPGYPRLAAADASTSRLASYSSWICLDTSTPERIGLPDGILETKPHPQVVNIDHHPDNAVFGDINIIDSTAAATAQILFHGLRAINGWSMTPETATLFLLGLTMDTGCFRFANTNPDCFMTASEMLRIGADHGTVVRRMYHSKPLQLLNFEAEIILNQLRIDCDGRFAWVEISPEILTRHGLKPADLEGIVEVVRAVAGVEIAAVLLLREEDVKVSLRSKNRSVSVGKIARLFDGGGHEMAAGCRIPTTRLNEAAQALSAHVRAALNGTAAGG
jgi:phosphoesterase RecJ-like protein